VDAALPERTGSAACSGPTAAHAAINRHPSTSVARDNCPFCTVTPTRSATP
jgi:hypothetical protein